MRWEESVVGAVGGMSEIKNGKRGVREWLRANRIVRRISQVKETTPRSLFTRPISRAHPVRHVP